MSGSIEHSRALLLGASASGLTPEKLQERLERAVTVVRLEPGLPGALLTARVLLTTLRRLPGLLALDQTGLEPGQVERLLAATANIDSSRPLQVVDAAPTDAVAKVHIGMAASDGWVRVIPDGYGAQILDDTSEATLGRPANALGSVCAAAFAAAEAFKRTAQVLHARCTRHGRLSFCPVTLSTDTTLAPDLPRGSELDAALVGNGAIGTAEALILAELALGGRVILCDPERFAPENRGTYSLGGEREAQSRPLKVEMVSALLTAAGYEVVPVPGYSTELIACLDTGEIAPPRTALTGLDSVRARRETQGLWCDHIIDGQTGNTAAGLVVAVPAGPCLQCFFVERNDGPDPLERAAAEFGLSMERLKQGQQLLGEEEIRHLPAEQQDRLRPYIGCPTCGLTSAVGLTDADVDGFLPAVPFVSQMAACLTVGRLLALELGVASDVNWFQMDVLHGPTSSGEQRNALPDCWCQDHPDIVEKLRRVRSERRG